MTIKNFKRLFELPIYACEMMTIE